jgi:phospholipid transport system substrate-binding protein
MRKLLLIMLLVPLIKADIKNIAYEYEKVMQSNIADNSEIYMFADNYYSTIEFFEEKIDFRRVAAGIMGREAYMKASQQQRADFINVLKPIYLDTLGEVTVDVLNNHKLTFIGTPAVGKAGNELRIEYEKNNRKIPVSIKYRNNNSSDPGILNMIFNGVNLGLTYKNQFQAYYSIHNGDVSKTIYDFDMGTSYASVDARKPDNILGKVLKQVIRDYPQAKLNARLRKEAYNRGVRDGYKNGRKNGGVAPLPKLEPSSVN